MAQVSEKIVAMIDMLPEEEQDLAYEFIKRMILAWDPDYSKVTPNEEEMIKSGEKEILEGEVINHNDIDW
jgi:precorrin isomerase